MSFSPNSNSGMGTQNRQQTSNDDKKLNGTLSESDDVPLDLSMPRFPNATKVPLPRNSYFSTVRNKPPPSYDVDTNDQPIDYSKKSFAERESKVGDPYGDYAETDLDQPTDYSLRYAEDDTDDDEKRNSTYFAVNEQEDTVKTYCTEGTPYETPLNFSTATSMSDLRLEDSKEVDGARRASKKINQEGRSINETIVCTKEEEEEDEISTKESKSISNELALNSSSASIEKPVNYYEEGTPGRISRVSSLSSLGEGIVGQNVEIENNVGRNGTEMIAALPVSPIPSVVDSREEPEDGDSQAAADDEGVGDDAAICGDEEEKGDAVSIDKEGKVVTFGGEDHYAEQTPLMFSRSSSLGSLSGFEQQSIHDDRSSIVSDFSRRTSGVVSPSELPDSPSQTVPPSPRHSQRVQSSDFSLQAPPLRQFPYVKSPRGKCSVFEDNIAAFKEESTPIEFSAATSLSSLTIDDEPKILLDSKEAPLNVYPEKARTIGRTAVVNNDEILDRNGNQVVINESHVETRERENDTDQVQVSDGDEDDEDILAACISIGMRTSMYREPLKKLSDIKEKSVHRIAASSSTNLVRYQTSSTLDRLEAGITSNSTEVSNNKISPDVVTVPTDTVHIYCTEDTPADISPVGSQSNLSALSMSSIHGDFEKDYNDKDNRLSGEEDDNWILTGDDEKILEECILSGIPKASGNNNSLSRPPVVPDFNSPSRVSPMRKSDGPLPRPTNVRAVPSASPPTVIETNEIPINRPSFNVWRDPVEPPRRSVHRRGNSYNDSSNQSDDEAVINHCVQPTLPKTKTNVLPFVNSSQRPRKSTKPPSRRPRMNDGSSHVVTQIFRGNVTRITITQSHEPEELFTDSSSGSDEEDDLILAQCIRSGMPKA